MCKVLIIPKITNETRKSAQAFVDKMKPLMSKYNSDGLGYSAIDSQGNLFGERWHNNSDAMLASNVVKETSSSFLKDFGTELVLKQKGAHNSFGKIALDDMTAITLHTRFATSGKEFTNTHPFVYPDQDTALIHNGVISNERDFNFKVSTCDSEAILISYLKSGVNKDIKKAQEMANMLRGYYACGVFSRDSAGNRILDVFKADANLYGVFIKELDSVVFSTALEDIENAALSLGFSLGGCYRLNEGWVLRYSGGDLVDKTTFKPAAKYSAESWGNWNKSHTPAKKSSIPEVVKPPTISKPMSEYLHLIPGMVEVQ